MQRPESIEYAHFYEAYVRLVPDGDVLRPLEDQVRETKALLEGVSEEQALYRYGPGKWSIRRS